VLGPTPPFSPEKIAAPIFCANDADPKGMIRALTRWVDSIEHFIYVLVHYLDVALLGAYSMYLRIN
jgi:hypothetical protein